MPLPIFVLDNGAHMAKVGLNNMDEPKLIPNCIMKAKAERRRAFIGDQINDCRDASGLYYILCYQRGYLMNWDTQKTVWDYIFSKDCMGTLLENRSIVITEPQMNFPSLQEATMEILFEEYRCSGVYKTTTAELAAYNYCIENENTNYSNLNCLVIDVGYSFAHVVPFIKGSRVIKAIRRVDVGGKALTNHLKELISYRHINVMDESYVVNQIKEDVCYVAQDFKQEMQVHTCDQKHHEVLVDYILPDFTTVRRGYVRDRSRPRPGEEQQQIVQLCNERFTVPELLFHPSDIGINQVGIPAAAFDAVKACPLAAHQDLLRNIIVIGGSSLLPGFIQRLKTELRAVVPDDIEVSLIFPDDPITYAWYGGKELANADNFDEVVFTRDDYEETGLRSFYDD